MKPILFNTDMVRAILENSKTVTRRVVKPQPLEVYHDGELFEDEEDLITRVKAQNGRDELLVSPYRPGDILYVREMSYKDAGRYMYKADYSDNEKFYLGGRREITIKWSPSIHMPKEAARIFLRVTDVRVEQLRYITRDEAVREGANPTLAVDDFKRIWNNTINPSKRALYGWDANPWVWVIEFERITKEEVYANG